MCWVYPGVYTGRHSREVYTYHSTQGGIVGRCTPTIVHPVVYLPPTVVHPVVYLPPTVVNPGGV